MKLKKHLITLLLLSSLEAKTQILNIDDIVELTLKHSPDIEVSMLNFQSAKERTKASKSFYLPSIDLHGVAGKQWSKQNDGRDINADVLSGTLGATQLLYDFGKIDGLVGSSKEQALALKAQMQQIISDKIFVVKNLYYNVLKAKSIIVVQKKNLVLQKQQLNRANKYLKAGIKTIIDVSDAEVRVERAKLDLENAQYDLEIQRASLEQEIGFVPNRGKYSLYRKELPLPNLSHTLPRISSSVLDLELFAYEHRYVLQNSKHIVKSSKSNANSKKANYYPTLSLGANYTAQETNNNILIPKEQGEVAVNLNWNIFSGYKTDAEVQEAKIEVLKASTQVNSVKLAIKREVLESHIGLRRSKKSVELSETISKSSEKKYEQAKKRYENELSDYIELQEAQQGYIESLSNLVNAYYNYYISMAQLDHAVGR